jgi:hypothetical protein
MRIRNPESVISRIINTVKTMDLFSSMCCRSGDILAVIDKLESSLGWWKAMKGGKLGYIPKVISAGLAKYPGVSFNRARGIFGFYLFLLLFFS